MVKSQDYSFLPPPRILTRGVFSLLAFSLLALITILSGNVKADMLVFWNFDSSSTQGSTNYVTDSVHSERLNLVNASIEDGKLFANGGYAEGTVEGTNGLNVTLPLGQSTNPNYTMSAFLATTHNVYQGVGIIAWGTGAKYQCNCFRTLGGSEGIGLDSYWWGADIHQNGYNEVYNGLENHVATTGDATNHYIYLNGQLIISNETHAREEANQNFTVGHTINGESEKLYGTIDNAAVYNEILQHSDIITISSSKVNGLTNWWKSGTTVDRISGIVKPETVTGTTVITGANGDVIVFNRALESGEQTYYQGQLATGHDYVIDNMAGSASTKTTWLRASSANLSDAGQTPLGIYVGGTDTVSTLTATAEQLNNVNRTLVIGGGTLAIAADSDVSIDKNRVGFDSGSLSTSGTGTITINSSENLSLKAVNIGNSALNLNSSGDMRIIGEVTGSGELVKSGTGSLTLTVITNSFTGDFTIDNGTVIATVGDYRYPTTSALGATDVAGRKVTVNKNGVLEFAVQNVITDASKTIDLELVLDGGNLINSTAEYNSIPNLTLKNGASVYAADGASYWKALKFYNLNVERVSDEIASDPVTISADMEKPNASISFGDTSSIVIAGDSKATINVAEITSANKQVNDNISDLVISAVITNVATGGSSLYAADIEKTGAGTMEFTAANTYTGKTTVSEGGLKLTDAAVVANGVIELGESGTLEYNVSSGETALVFTTSAYVSGAGDIFKTGEGRLKINTDAIDIDTEDLIEFSADNFVVASGRVDIRGYMNGQLEVDSGATFSPGNSIGEATFGGGFILNEAGAELLMEIGGKETDKNDSLIVTGELELNNGLIYLELADDSTLKGGDTFTAILYGSNSGEDGFAENLLSHVSSYYFTDLDYVPLGNGVYAITGTVDPNAVPEPSTWALLILGAAGLLYVRKRNK